MQTDQTALPPFRVTDAAIAQIEALGGAVRIDVERGGSCGTVYSFSILNSVEESRQAGETVYGCPGAWLAVGDELTALLPGATLDYAGRLKPPRFRVLRNPNTQEVCACRRSFGEPWPGPGQPECRSYTPMPWDVEFEPPGRWQRQTGYTRNSE